MQAHRHLCLGPSSGKHLSGGSSIASVVRVLEAVTKRSLINANAQFFGSPKVDQTFEIAILKQIAGKSITQALGCVRVGDRDLVLVTASLGKRDDAGCFVWEQAPVVPTPEQCPRVPFVRQEEGDLHTHLDMRLALDPRANPQGRAIFWVRTDSTDPVTSAFLCQIADYLPEAIHMNMGRPAGAVSLDNVVRMLGRATTPWLLCDIQLGAISDGLFHGRMAIFAQDGTALALASQSGVVRLFER
jgi:acyl-CoA thioesterase II